MVGESIGEAECEYVCMYVYVYVSKKACMFVFWYDIILYQPRALLIIFGVLRSVIRLSCFCSDYQI